jgi:7-keto-8-aminopelargonate synthetase-like enzyme
MVYPAVPYDSARLRFFVNCTHTPEQIRFTLDALASKHEALQHEEDRN